MKVVHIIVGLNVGGAELMLKRLVASTLCDVEHTVISLTDLGLLGPDFSRMGVRIRSLNIRGVRDVPFAFFALRRLIKGLDPDVVHTWMYHADFLGGIAAKAAGVRKVIWSVRNTRIAGRGAINYAFRLLCAFLSHFVPTKVIFVSDSAKVAHIGVGYCRRKAVTIYNGFDLSVFRFDPDARQILRVAWGVTDQDFLVCSIGRFDSSKDHLGFIRAAKIAMSVNNKIKVVMLGKQISLGNSFLVEEIGEEIDRFILLGARTDVDKVLSASECFCLHSVTEGFPNVLGEAMAVERVCIATDAGDAHRVLDDQRFSVPVRDTAALARKIVEVSYTSSAIRSVIGARNRERIGSEFSLNKVVGDYLKIYS